MKNLVLITLMAMYCSCRKAPVSCDGADSLFQHSEFPVGVAINADKLIEGSDYERIATAQFNSITPENVFKASFLHPNENTFKWSGAEALADYCALHGKRLHGHTLIWHEQLPEWIENFEGSRDQWASLFRVHIQTIVAHFKGRVSGWDVVNEAFEEDGTLRRTIWREHLGDGYIEQAFAYAHEADPGARLFYNDYMLEGNSTKRNAVLKYFSNLRSRGVKVDGIGLQCHITTLFPEREQLSEAMESVAREGFMVHLSEVDISVNPLNQSMEGKDMEELLAEQADILGSLITSFNSITPSLRYGITFWGIGDGDSWIRSHFNRQDYPLLYDDNYRPKQAYCKLKNLL